MKHIYILLIIIGCLGISQVISNWIDKELDKELDKEWAGILYKGFYYNGTDWVLAARIDKVRYWPFVLTEKEIRNRYENPNVKIIRNGKGY